MNGLLSAIDWRTALADQGWWFIWLGFLASVIFAFFEHRELKREIRRSLGKKRMLAVWKLVLLWTIPCLALVGAAASQWGAEKAEKKITLLEDALDQEKHVVTNALKQVADLDPRSFPIATIVARAHFSLRGSLTNLSYRWNKDESKTMGIAQLQLGKLSSAATGLWLIKLKALDYVQLGGRDEGTFCLDFTMDPIAPMWNVRSNDPAGLLDEIDTLALYAFFLREQPEILGGRVTLTMNATLRKEFLIPPQHPDVPIITVVQTNGYACAFDCGQGVTASPYPIAVLTNRFFF